MDVSDGGRLSEVASTLLMDGEYDVLSKVSSVDRTGDGSSAKPVDAAKSEVLMLEVNATVSEI